MPKNILKRYFLNYSILIPYFILNIIGLIMVYSSTSYKEAIAGKNSAKIVIIQALFFVLSLILLFVIYKIKTNWLKKRSVIKFLMLIGIGLLIFTLFFGKTINGCKGWLYLGFFSVQPAEYFKFLIPLYLASEFANNQSALGNHHYQVLKKPLLFVLLPIIIVMLMPDLGNAVILILIVLIMLAVSGVSYRFTTILAPLAIGGGAFCTFLILITKGQFLPKYVFARFLAFANPFDSDIIQNQGHQLANSYYAIYNGQFLGRGLGNSLQKKGYLPAAHTDFIFSIVIEELGAITALTILGIVIYLIMRIILVGTRASKSFNSMLALGIGGMILIQLFINLGGVIGLIPSTGVTFPFLSQGGNSILVLSVGIALVLNVSSDESRNNLYKYLQNNNYLKEPLKAERINSYS